jgi:hypothetical protein
LPSNQEAELKPQYHQKQKTKKHQISNRINSYTALQFSINTMVTFSPSEIIYLSWVPVAHACNLSYSGGRDQEDHGSKPVLTNSMQDPISKTTHHKKGLAEWLKALSSSPRTTKKKKKKKRKERNNLLKYKRHVFCFDFFFFFFFFGARDQTQGLRS